MPNRCSIRRLTRLCLHHSMNRGPLSVYASALFKFTAGSLLHHLRPKGSFRELIHVLGRQSEWALRSVPLVTGDSPTIRRVRLAQA